MIIRKDRTWLALYSIACAVSLWFTGVAGYALWEYWRLDTYVPAYIREWGVVEKGAAAFSIGATYSYEIRGVTYEAHSLFKEPCYLNRPSAESDMKKLSGRAWQIWVDSAYPFHSAFQKIFPFKAAAYALMSLGVAAYFLLLKRKVSLESIAE